MSIGDFKRVPYSRGVYAADIPGFGRYVLRRKAKYSRLWVLLLNDKEIGIFNCLFDAHDATLIAIRDALSRSQPTSDR